MLRSIRVALTAIVIAAICGVGLISCEPTIKDGGNTTANNSSSNTSSNTANNENSSEHIGSASSGSVAATINGVPLYEDTITNDIEKTREEEGLTDTYAWQEWMGTNGYTSATVRETVIDQYVTREAVKAGCQEYGLSADQEGIDEALNKIKGLYTDENAWNKALSDAGYTEETYRAELEEASLEQAIMDKLCPDGTSDEQQTAIEEWLESYKYNLNVVIYDMPSGLPYSS